MDLEGADIPAVTEKQAAILEQFRQTVSDVLQPKHDDYFLLRWLRARGWDIKKAEKMLRKSMAWRRQSGVDTILTTYTAPEVLRKYYPGGHCGFDKNGNPIWLEPMGNMDPRGLMYSCKKSDIIRYKMYTNEMMVDVCRKQTEKLGRKIGRVFLIYDFENYGLRHLWKPGFDLTGEIFDMIESNCPEFLKICFVINAPSVFPVAFNLIKPFLNEETRKKVHVLGKNWQQRVFELIDRDQLPVHWGGTLTGPDGDPYMRPTICTGGLVPESYYSINRSEIDISSMSTLLVGRGSSMQVELQVTQANSIIRWYILTDSFDIGFGIFRRTSDERQNAGDMELVHDLGRVNTHMVPEEGMVSVKDLGTYVARFDNTYSWVNAKKVLYLIQVLAPAQDLNADSDWAEAIAQENLDTRL